MSAVLVLCCVLWNGSIHDVGNLFFNSDVAIMALVVWAWCNVDVAMMALVIWVLWHRRHGHYVKELAEYITRNVL